MPTCPVPPPPAFVPALCRFLQLLHQRKVKRIMLLSDGRAAIVEVPVENTESDFYHAYNDRRDDE